MTIRRPSRSESTPVGGLDEARLHDVLGYQMAQATIVTDAVFKSQVGEPYGLRPVEYTLLMLVAENPGGSLVRLARALAVTAPNITTWIDRLEARGLVQRAQSDTDRRVQVLHATAQGAEMARQATQRIVDAERQALAGHLSAAERAILLELLHKLACARGTRSA